MIELTDSVIAFIKQSVKDELNHLLYDEEDK